MSANIGEIVEELKPQVPARGGQIRGRGGWRLAISSFVENRLAVVGTGIIAFFVLFCFAGPIFYTPTRPRPT